MTCDHQVIIKQRVKFCCPCFRGIFLLSEGSHSGILEYGKYLLYWYSLNYHISIILGKFAQTLIYSFAADTEKVRLHLVSLQYSETYHIYIGIASIVRMTIVIYKNVII